MSIFDRIRVIVAKIPMILATIAIVGPIGFVLYTVFVVAPAALYTEAECLRNGYPKAEVTIGLERYCMTLDGVVTVKVFKP